jgi:HK97 family phage major capsid protein
MREQLRSTHSEMTALSEVAVAERRDLTAAEVEEYGELEARYDGLKEEVERIDPPLTRALSTGLVPAPDYRAGEWLASELRVLSGGSGLGAAITPSQPATFALDHLAAQSVGLKSGFTVLSTDRDSLLIPHTLSDSTSSWTAEGAPINAADVNANTITATPKKLATYEIVSNEVINDAQPDVLAVVESRLLRGMANTLDLGFYEGSGASNQPSGLKTVLTAGQQVSMGTNGAAPTNLDPWATAIAQLESSNANANAIVMHPRTWGELLKLKTDTAASRNQPLLTEFAGSPTGGVTRALYGIPVYLSSQISTTETQGTGTTCSSSYVYEADRIYAVRRQDVTLEVDRSVLFASDQTAIRAISRWDIVVPDIAAGVRIVGIL